MTSASPDTRLTVGLCNLAFVTMLTYAVASSAAQSLYLSAYGSKQLPYVWLGVGLASAAATFWLGRLSQRYDVVRLFGLACRFSGLSLAALLLCYGARVPHAAFALYVWKDVYIIVLVELFWTFANVVFGVGSASRTYGYFCAAGSLGSVVGNVALARTAGWVGTAWSMWSIVPLLAVLAVGCRRLTRNVPVPEPRHAPKPNFRQMAQTLRKSSYLPWLMVLVASVQATLTLIDYRYSGAVEHHAANEAQRTEILSNMSALINLVSFGLQMGTAPLLRVLGLPLTLFLVPLTLALTLVWASVARSFLAVAACMVVGKCLDYSIFRAAKEILYIPLDYAEKTQGKALVDIFTYRTAKGLVSLLLLGLPLLGVAHARLTTLSLALVSVWLLAIVVILRRYNRLQKARRPHERG